MNRTISQRYQTIVPKETYSNCSYALSFDNWTNRYALFKIDNWHFINDVNSTNGGWGPKLNWIVLIPGVETIIINTHHHDHDVVLFERAVEPEERDDEDDDSSRDTKRREREEPLRQELMVPIVGSLNRTAHRQYNDTSYLKTPTHEHMTSHKLHYAHYIHSSVSTTYQKQKVYCH